jgi:hypothetical protein
MGYAARGNGGGSKRDGGVVVTDDRAGASDAGRTGLMDDRAGASDAWLAGTPDERADASDAWLAGTPDERADASDAWRRAGMADDRVVAPGARRAGVTDGDSSLANGSRRPFGAGAGAAVREARERYGGETGGPRGDEDAPEDPGDLDALEDLADEIAVLSAHIHAATHRLLELIAEFDRRQGWKSGEYRSCAHWLSFRTGIDVGSAREKVRVARALESLPETSAAMARGELSFSKVRALSRIARADTEGDLLEFALVNTAHQLERLVRGWRDLNRTDEARREQLRHAARTFSVFPNDAGMYEVRGTLDPEVGAALMRAVEEAGDALFREEWRRSPLEPETTPEQRRADAVGLIAERALAAGFGAGEEGDDDAEEVGDAMVIGDDTGDIEGDAIEAAGAATPAGAAAANDETAASDAADAGDAVGACAGTAARNETAAITQTAAKDETAARAAIAARDTTGGTRSAARRSSCGCRASIPISGSRAARTQIVLHLDPATLMPGALPGRSHLEDGTRVAAATSRRLSCDASVVPVRRGAAGGKRPGSSAGAGAGASGAGDACCGTSWAEDAGVADLAGCGPDVLDVGRSTRTIPPSIRRALEIRDGGCRFPGCGLRFTEGHHIQHWVEGGETKLANLVLLCRFHHRAVHEGGFGVRRRDDGLKFYTPEGWPLGDTPPRVVVRHGDPVVALVHANRRRGVKPHRHVGAAVYEREADIPDALLFRAFEAIDTE